MGLSLAVLSPSLQRRNTASSLPWVTPPWRTPLTWTGLQHWAGTAFIVVLRLLVRLDFALKGRVWSWTWFLQKTPCPEKYHLLLSRTEDYWNFLVALAVEYLHASCYGYSLYCNLSPPTLGSFHRAAAFEANREIRSGAYFAVKDVHQEFMWLEGLGTVIKVESCGAVDSLSSCAPMF